MPVLRLVVLVVGLSLWVACTPPLSSVTPEASRAGSGGDHSLPREPSVDGHRIYAWTIPAPPPTQP